MVRNMVLNMREQNRGDGYDPGTGGGKVGSGGGDDKVVGKGE